MKGEYEVDCQAAACWNMVIGAFLAYDYWRIAGI